MLTCKTIDHLETMNTGGNIMVEFYSIDNGAAVLAVGEECFWLGKSMNQWELDCENDMQDGFHLIPVKGVRGIVHNGQALVVRIDDGTVGVAGRAEGGAVCARVHDEGMSDEERNVISRAVDLYEEDDVSIREDDRPEQVEGGWWVEARVFVSLDVAVDEYHRRDTEGDHEEA